MQRKLDLDCLCRCQRWIANLPIQVAETCSRPVLTVLCGAEMPLHAVGKAWIAAPQWPVAGGCGASIGG
jgi:hypothetical protein